MEYKIETEDGVDVLVVAKSRIPISSVAAELIKHLNSEITHYKLYATHWPTCDKPRARSVGYEVACTCGLDQ